MADIPVTARISMTGIGTITECPDLLERCIVLFCQRVPKSDRKTLQEVLSAFQTDLPSLLYYAMETLSKAVGIYDSINISELPRMADFAKWGYAISEVWGYGGEYFLNIYNKNQTEILEIMAEENTLLMVIISFAEHNTYYKGKVSELLPLLTEHAQQMKFDTKLDWVKGDSSLGKKLRQLTSVLEQFDIYVNCGKSNGKRYVEIWKESQRSANEERG